MISDAVVKAIARRHGVDPMVVDLDHALGVTLWGVARAPVGEQDWVFKGGTCLRKAYFEDYRFSEDLDFTVTGALQVEDVSRRLESIAGTAREVGVSFLLDDARVDVTRDEYGRESVDVRVPYRGALTRRGSPRSIQFHLSADEEILIDPRRRSLLHPYDDATDIETELLCYAPEEMLAEKLRATGGQRVYAISRDVYDIAQLVMRGVDVERALSILPGKARLKGVDLEIAAERFRSRREEYRADWERAVVYLADDPGDFESSFETTARLLGRFE